MAVYQKDEKILDYCSKIRELCQNEHNPNMFCSKLREILKNLNNIKKEAKLKLSIYIIEKSDD